ncbi:MAG: aminotransferase class V-fold PLP-dependent enzyme [Fimbriimonadaceae bacterium]|nr:aminotransferase class V-fold PLP-dependent enzyme [Fimbriimonadaceae bacterium]
MSWADQIRPRFSRVLARDENEIYLANHSLGRLPDVAFENLSRFTESWATQLDSAWSEDGWLGEMAEFREQIADLLSLPEPDLIVAKTSAGQGLRAVLNSFSWDRPIRVVATAGEFDSVDFILRAYRDAGRAELHFVEASENEGPVALFTHEAIQSEITSGTDLVVLSAVTFGTGQVLPGLSDLIAHAHSLGALVVIDAYHGLGVLPFNQMELDADFVIGGCYKYLRGGPGACFLGLHPRVAADDSKRTLDTGWFAKRDTFSYERPEHAERWPGGQGWQESTPPVITAYQANPGLAITREVGVGQIRAHNLTLQRHLREALRTRNVGVFEPADENRFGAFVLLPATIPNALCSVLKAEGVNADARGSFVRLGPDFLNTFAQLTEAAERIARVQSI